MSKTYFYNRRAKQQYQVTDQIEAGMVLSGEEVRSIRNSRGQITGAYAKLLVNKNSIPELWLVGANIGSGDNQAQSRKLLLHKKELKSLIGKLQEKKMTLVPISVYGRRGKIKVSLGLAKGKEHRDRRQEIKKREIDREISRSIKNAR